MFKYRIRMFLNELKVLAFMRSGGSSPAGARRARTPRVVRAGLGALGGALRGDCSRWPPFDCSERGEGGDDAEEYYGCSETDRPRSSEPARPRSLALEDPAKPLDTAAPSLPSLSAGGLDPGLDTGHASLPSLTESGIGSPQCRICFQGLEQGELLSACRCAGSVRCTHQPCLIRWISERGSWSCELCYFKYHVLAISTKNPLQWQAISLTVIEKVQIAAIFLGSLFLMASISWLVWSSFSPSARWQRQDLLFQICYGMYGFMDIVCIGLIIHEGSSVYRIFQRWQAVNQQWKILNYVKQKDLGGASSAGDAHKGGASSGGAAPPTGGTDRGGRGGVRGGRGGASERVRRTLLNHHCGSTLLHMLSQFRAHRPPPGSSNHEVVMRVTTV